MKHPYFHRGERPVFDNSRFGGGIQAERQDEPGMELEGYGLASMLETDLHGDWSWKPNRNRRYGRNDEMPTYRPPRHPRACPSCHLTACLGPDYHELADTQDFQQRARTAHRQAGDYNRHTHDYSIP